MKTGQILVLGQYDPHSKQTVKNVARKYRVNGSLHPVPHLAGFMDAAQEGRAIDFMFRNRSTSCDHENHFFMQCVRALAQTIIERAGTNKPRFGEKGE